MVVFKSGRTNSHLSCSSAFVKDRPPLVGTFCFPFCHAGGGFRILKERRIYAELWY
nr:MAG TPA: hypothetical protein [Caudoviricetes sp.]